MSAARTGEAMRGSALRVGAAAVALGVPVALGVAAAMLARKPVVFALAAAGAGLVAGFVVVARRLGLLGTWIALALLAILAGGLGAISVSGQSGHILYADGVVGVGVLAIALRGRLRVEWPRAPFLDALWPMLAWAGFTILLSRDPLSGISEFKEWAMAAIVGVAAVAYARDGARVRILLGAVALTGALIGVHMVYVTITCPFGPIFALVMKLVDLPWGRSNYLAGLLILAIPATLGLLGEARSVAARLTLWALLLGNVAGLAVSSSKGAILSLVIALAVAYGAERRAPRAMRWAVLGVFAAGVAVFSTGALQEVWKYHLQQHSLDYSAGERMDLYRLAWQQFVAHPLFGVGLDNFEIYSNRLHGVDTVPHNYEIGYLCELGVPGFLLVMAWTLALARTAWRARGACLARGENAIGLAMWAAFLGFAIHNQFESTIYGQQYKMMFVVVAAATWGLGRELPKARPAEG
jgi:O-antigen ligase